ncbi:helix-turn-helix domain-containing protein [Runella aurantiaca]|uniref:AraC family transcriptional regulator n=1 Tax=Runella aurantiaca TaxID=2282308 RepID=A0A369I3L4_9BACT|nr:AraC family transcriptional regulator [Runella aurantiaca]RDB03500.1 AraC family transcriptional regulator [Runella aurantiaca]
MKTEFEVIRPDEGSSFRILHNVVLPELFRWQFHYHPEYEIVCVFHGSGRRHVGMHLSHYEDGDLVFIGPNVPHSGFGQEAVGPHEEIVVQLKENLLGEHFLEMPEMKAVKRLFERSHFGVCFHGETKIHVKQRLKKLLGLPPFERLMELVNILQILATTSESTLLNTEGIKLEVSPKDELRLNKILKYVEENYQKPIDIQEIASITHLTVPSFCHYFKKMMNITFTDFVNRYRVNQACRLLSTGKSITDIGYESGFGNVAYFNRVFKAHKQQNPSEYRKALQK